MKHLQVKPCIGFWWVMVDESLPLWVRIGSIPSIETKELQGTALMAKMYYGFGILGNVCSVGFIGDLRSEIEGKVVDLKTGEIVCEVVVANAI